MRGGRHSSDLAGLAPLHDTGELPAMFSLVPRSWFVPKAGRVEAIPTGRL